jgi:hypothetical protein
VPEKKKETTYDTDLDGFGILPEIHRCAAVWVVMILNLIQYRKPCPQRNPIYLLARCLKPQRPGYIAKRRMGYDCLCVVFL